MLKGLRKFRSFSALPAFLWLFSQLLMSGLFMTSPAFADDVDGVFSDKIVICGPNGIRYVSAASLGLEIEGEQPQEKVTPSQSCEWCLGFGNNAALPTPEINCRAPFSQITVISFETFEFSKQSLVGTWLFNGRAPPSSKNNA